MTERPFVSMCMPTYRQGKFVKEALESLLAQTYSPLEICIADDCSPDDTAEIIEKTIAAYKARGGGHTVRFVRNKTNLGCLENFENVFSMARGELIFDCGGDDISLPDRVEKVVAAWQKDGCRAGVIVHSGVYMAEDNSVIRQIKPRGATQDPVGAITVYGRSVIDKFPKTSYSGTWEDHIFGFRGLLTGSELRLPDILVNKRVGGTSSGSSPRKNALKIARVTAIARRQNLADLESYKSNLSEVKYRQMKTDVERWLRYETLMIDICGGGGLLQRYRAFRELAKRGIWKANILNAFYLLPIWITDPVQLGYRKLREKFRK